MHLKRLIVALILLPVLYVFVMRLPSVYFLLLVMAVAFFGQVEFLSMYKVRAMTRYLFSFISIAPIYLAYEYHEVPLLAILLIFGGIVFTRLLFKKSPEHALVDLSPLWIGFFYISILLSYLIMIRSIRAEWIIFLGAVVWGADTFAYYTGKVFGRRKLYEEVSPNKTIEGAFGSIGGAVFISILIRFLLPLDISLEKAILAAIIIGVVGVIGDLVESMFKRDAGVKDSGHLIPGHGGVLDKVDGMLFTAPFLYYLIIFWD